MDLFRETKESETDIEGEDAGNWNYETDHDLEDEQHDVILESETETEREDGRTLESETDSEPDLWRPRLMETETVEKEDVEFSNYETATLLRLKSKELTVSSSDGTVRCPLCSSGKYRTVYSYKNLLLHATAASAAKGGRKAAGQHSALKKFLESNHPSSFSPSVAPAVGKEVSRRREAEAMLVCPWSVVICNIDNSQIDAAKGIQIGLDEKELQRLFAEFNPAKVYVFWGEQGHLGFSVLQFGKDLSGLKDAQALAKSFAQKEHDLTKYERNAACGDLGSDFYGWLAGEEDCKGRSGHQGSEIARYFKAYGSLMDIGMFGEELKRIHDQHVNQLEFTLSEKQVSNVHLKSEMKIIRRTAAADMLQVQELHRSELEAVRLKARSSEDMYNRAMGKKEAELLEREKELREECDLQSGPEKIQLEKKIIENRELQDRVKLLQDEKARLVHKHEEEARMLAERAHKDQLELAKKHRKEMEKRHLESRLETEKGYCTRRNGGNQGHQKKIEDLQKQLEELDSTQEFNQELINSLLMKEREANDEIADARKVAAKVVQAICDSPARELITAAHKTAKRKDRRYLTVEQKIEVKMAGAIDHTPWPQAFQRHGVAWNEKMALALSKWENRIGSSKYHPFKNVKIGEEKWKQEIDHNDKDLRSLKKTLGEEVYKSVTTALMEIEEYNASGRYPIPIAWNVEQSRQATVREVIAYAGEVIKAFVASKAAAPCKRVRYSPPCERARYISDHARINLP